MQRIRRAIARHGPLGALRAAGERLWEYVLLSEHHVWYALDLASRRPRRELDRTLTLRRGGTADLPLLARLPTISTEAARARLAAGSTLWLVLEGRDPRFACWIFRDRTPVIAVGGGQMALAHGTACLEDSVSAAAARGRGVAPGAWTSIADGLAAEGLGRLITKVEVDNVASRRAVEKIGFRSGAHALPQGRAAGAHARRRDRSRSWSGDRGHGAAGLMIEHTTDLSAVRKDWTRLALGENVFATWEWADAWSRHLGTDADLAIGVVRDDDGEASAILPLSVQRFAGLRVARFIGSSPADQLGPLYSSAIESSDVAGALRHHVADILGGGGLFLGERIWSGEALQGDLGHTLIHRTASPVPPTHGASFEEYLASRSRNLRSQVRRRERKLRGLPTDRAPRPARRRHGDADRPARRPLERAERLQRTAGRLPPRLRAARA